MRSRVPESFLGGCSVGGFQAPGDPEALSRIPSRTGTPSPKRTRRVNSSAARILRCPAIAPGQRPDPRRRCPRCLLLIRQCWLEPASASAAGCCACMASLWRSTPVGMMRNGAPARPPARPMASRGPASRSRSSARAGRRATFPAIASGGLIRVVSRGCHGQAFPGRDGGCNHRGWDAGRMSRGAVAGSFDSSIIPPRG
jgi:hypothetical protein